MYNQAMTAISEAEAIIVTAGAGMGVDSGLPDFRGNKGFWNAYPEYSRLRISFEQCANPRHFCSDPEFGWGFYGHRTNLYRETIPHDGFQLIHKWISHKTANYFVVTSNVDGQFQKAGFAEENILEVHGSIHWLQCQDICKSNIWKNDTVLAIDQDTMRATSLLPACPVCGKISRPNILMFNDWNWLSCRTTVQENCFNQFFKTHSDQKIVVIELGAGNSIPTIRKTSERIGKLKNARVIRINPREPEIAYPHISIAAGALEALQKIDNLLQLKWHSGD